MFSKGNFTRPNGESTISRNEFLEYTKSIWSFQTESAKRIGHPAPFPVELPYRLIQLYSFKEDIILDPFIGSGTTALVAKKLGRNFVGIELNEEYIKMAENRINSIL